MKNILLMLSIVSITLFSCNDDFEDDNLDFSNSLPAYVELSSGSDIAATPGETVSVTVRLREARSEDVTVTYSITGDLTGTGSVVIDAGTVSSVISVTVPATPLTGTATVTLTDAGELSLGRPNTADPIARDIVWE